MSFVIGNERLSSKGYHYFHALYFKESVTLESMLDAGGVRELINAGLVESVDLKPGVGLEFTGKGRVLAYLFYTNGEIRAKQLTKLCNWHENTILLQAVARSHEPTQLEEIREYTTFLWWLNKIKAGLTLDAFSLSEVVECLDLPFELTESGQLTLTLPRLERKMVV